MIILWIHKILILMINAEEWGLLSYHFTQPHQADQYMIIPDWVHSVDSFFLSLVLLFTPEGAVREFRVVGMRNRGRLEQI
jgi:hypothetical protein